MSYVLVFLAGFLFFAAFAAGEFFVNACAEAIRELRGKKCPKCHGEGRVEDVDIDSRSVSLWPCTCRAGRKFAKGIRK